MDTNVSIYLNHYVWAPYFKEGGAQMGLGLQEIGEQLMQMDTFPEPVLAKRCLAWRGRLVHRLMQQLPWTTHGSALWVNGDPLLRHQQWGGLDEVMRVLMPLVRQLRAHVMVPTRQFWFVFWNIFSPGAPAQLQDWDPTWQTPPMRDDERRAVVIDGLKSRLEPLGFEFEMEEGPDRRFWFTRPLRPGGGYQLVHTDRIFHARLLVTSARYLQLEQLRGGGASNTLKGVAPAGIVLLQELERISAYPFDTIGYQEDAAWYFEEFDRFFPPALAHVHTAKDLYEWYWDDCWSSFGGSQGGIYSLYAARFLPDAEFLPIVDRFMAEVPRGPMNEFAQLMRKQPVFKDELI
jgi:hypothetical protein